MAKKKTEDEQQMIPGAEEAIKAQIADDLRNAKIRETKRLEHGREEQKYKSSAKALMEKYEIDDFVFGEGAERVHGFFEETKKIKVRIGDEPEEE